jgi:hypothetical protein
MTVYGEKAKQTSEEFLPQIEDFLLTFVQFSSHLEKARLDVCQWREQVRWSCRVSSITFPSGEQQKKENGGPRE